MSHPALTHARRLAAIGALALIPMTGAQASPPLTDAEARYRVAMQFTPVPVGVQIARQGNAALSAIRAGLRLTLLPLPTPRADLAAAERLRQDS